MSKYSSLWQLSNFFLQLYSAGMSSGFRDPYQKPLLPQTFAVPALQVAYFGFFLHVFWPLCDIYFILCSLDGRIYPSTCHYKFYVFTDMLTLSAGPVHMIQFKFRRLEIPPDFDVDHLGKILSFRKITVHSPV